jgi:uncharacterized protein
MAEQTGSFSDNEALKRFEWSLDGATGFINYNRSGTRITLVHTEIPPPWRGRGIGSALVEAALRYIDAKGWTIVVFCVFIQAYLRKHPEWQRLVDPHVHPKDLRP